MDVDFERLSNHYKELTNEELLRVHASGDLTEVAYTVLEMELKQRKIPVPQRSSSESSAELEINLPTSLKVAVGLMISYGVLMALEPILAGATSYWIGRGFGVLTFFIILTWALLGVKKYGWVLSVFFICGHIGVLISDYIEATQTITNPETLSTMSTGVAFYVLLLFGALVALLMDDSRKLFEQPNKKQSGYKNIDNQQELMGEILFDNDLVEYFTAAVGTNNTMYYVERFIKFEKRGIFATWNWPAFFVTFIWFMYRKMWVWALPYFILVTSTNILFEVVFHDAFPTGSLTATFTSLALLVFSYIIVPAYANALYFRHIKDKIEEAKSHGGGNHDVLTRLKADGGTGNITSILFTVLLIIITLIMIPIAFREYQDYTRGGHITEEQAHITEGIRGVDYASRAKDAVTEYYNNYGRLPRSNTSLGHSEWKLIKDNTIKSVTIEYGSVHITYNDEIGSTGGSIVYIPAVKDGSLSWSCRAVDMPKRLLPSSCSSILELPAIDTLQELEEFNLYYYKKKDVDLVSFAMSFLDNNIDRPTETIFGSVTGFYGQVFRENPERLDEWINEIDRLSERTQPLFFNALWLSNTPQAKKYLADKTDKVVGDAKVTMQELIGSEPPDLREVIPGNPIVGDMVWGAFLVTGDPRYIVNIIEATTHYNNREDFKVFYNAGLGKWSLASNAQQHEIVYQTLQQQLSEYEGEKRDIIQDVLDKANSLSGPNTLLEEMKQVIDEQNRIGKWLEFTEK